MRLSTKIITMSTALILGVVGCSSNTSTPITQAPVTTKEEIVKNKEIKETKEKQEEKGLAISSLTVEGKTIYLDKCNYSDLIKLMQKANDTEDDMGFLSRDVEPYDSLETNMMTGVTELVIYNPTEETIKGANCKISRLSLSPGVDILDNIYFLDGKININSTEEEIEKAFEDLGVDYKKNPTSDSLWSDEKTVVLNLSEVGALEVTNRNHYYEATCVLPTGHEISIEIPAMKPGYGADITIRLPELLD